MVDNLQIFARTNILPKHRHGDGSLRPAATHSFRSRVQTNEPDFRSDPIRTGSHRDFCRAILQRANICVKQKASSTYQIASAWSRNFHSWIYLKHYAKCMCTSHSLGRIKLNFNTDFIIVIIRRCILYKYYRTLMKMLLRRIITVFLLLQSLLATKILITPR